MVLIFFKSIILFGSTNLAPNDFTQFQKSNPPQRIGIWRQCHRDIAEVLKVLPRKHVTHILINIPLSCLLMCSHSTFPTKLFKSLGHSAWLCVHMDTMFYNQADWILNPGSAYTNWVTSGQVFGLGMCLLFILWTLVLSYVNRSKENLWFNLTDLCYLHFILSLKLSLK